MGEWRNPATISPSTTLRVDDAGQVGRLVIFNKNYKIYAAVVELADSPRTIFYINKLITGKWPFDSAQGKLHWQTYNLKTHAAVVELADT